jgi:hypothetical protein
VTEDIPSGDLRVRPLTDAGCICTYTAFGVVLSPCDLPSFNLKTETCIAPSTPAVSHPQLLPVIALGSGVTPAGGRLGAERVGGNPTLAQDVESGRHWNDPVPALSYLRRTVAGFLRAEVRPETLTNGQRRAPQARPSEVLRAITAPNVSRATTAK